MNRLTRRSLLATLGTVTAAGCVGDPDPGTPSESTPTDGATTDETRSTTGDWVERASNSPDPDHSISLRNEADEAETVRVRVVREATGETVFETTESVASGGGFTLYNLREADPKGVEAFRICAELIAGTATAATANETTGKSDARGCITVRTNECYGNAHVTVGEDGSVRIVYAIC